LDFRFTFYALVAKSAAEVREMSREEKAQHARLCPESRALMRQAVNIPTINKTITTLGSVLTYAVRSKLIDSNPVHEVERPLAQVEGTEEKDVQVISSTHFGRLRPPGSIECFLDSG
jgi:hypothetical protein